MASGVYTRHLANLMSKLVNMHSGGDTFKVALLDNSHSFNPDHNVWTDVSANEISGTGYTTGGEALTGQSVTQDDTNDLAFWDATDVEWTSATFTAYHAVIYDDTVSDNLVLSIDFGGEKSVTSGTFTIIWSANGIFRIT